jgi:hypothetical protein
MHRVLGAGNPNLQRLKNLAWLRASQLSKLIKALSASWVDKRGIIFDERSSPDIAYILLSGVARITCRNRKGSRVQVIVLSPGMIPSFTAASGRHRL